MFNTVEPFRTAESAYRQDRVRAQFVPAARRQRRRPSRRVGRAVSYAVAHSRPSVPTGN